MSCRKTNENNGAEVQRVFYKYKVDTVHMALHNNLSGIMLKPQYYYDGGHKIISYNNVEHALEIYHFDSLNNSEKIKLHYRGEHGIESVSDLYVLGKDSVLIRSKYSHLYIVSLKNEPRVIKKINLNTIKGINQQDYTFLREGIHARNFDDLAVSENYKYVLLPIYPTIRKKEWEKFHQKEFMAKIWLNKDSASVMPITYPKVFTKHSYADFDYPDFNWVNNKILFAFRNQSTVYTCDPIGNNNKKFPLNANRLNETITPAPKKSKYDTEYLRNSSYFYGIKYDAFRKLYYRFYVAKNNHPSHYYMMVLDSSLTKVTEITLPIKPFGRDIITPEGIMFPIDSKVDGENTCLQWGRIRFKNCTNHTK
jgi:hypothetical protein